MHVLNTLYGEAVFLSLAATAMVIVAWLERRPSTWHLGFVSLLLVFGASHLLVPSPGGAMLLALVIAAGIGIASKVKYRHVGFNLVAGDAIHLLRDSYRLLFTHYRALVTSLVLVAISLLGSAAYLAATSFEVSAPMLLRTAIMSGSVSAYWVTWKLSGGKRRFRVHLLTQDRAHLSAFIASCIGAGPRRRPEIVDIAPEPLPLAEAQPGREAPHGEAPPDIVLVLHESTFDPRDLGFGSTPLFDDFFRPPGSKGGSLNVDIFGGSTWQSEFAVYAGLSSLCFGDDSRFVFHRLAGRIRHALPRYLSDRGFRTVHMSSDPDRFEGSFRFYQSVGFQEVRYPKGLFSENDFRRWTRERHDDLYFASALDVLGRDVERDRQPVFLSIMTLMNHGGHTTRLFDDDRHDLVRRAAIAETGSRAHGEYCVRLAESAMAYRAFRERLAVTTRRPTIIVRYGDHQPSFTAGLLGLRSDDRTLFKTFYSIEMINGALPDDFAAPAQLDTALLSTVILQAAGLPLDPVFATRASLIEECGSAYFASPSQRKRRFHRTLVEQGHIYLG